MTYYHVRITPKSDISHDELRLDLTLEELSERFLTPYNRARPIAIAGKTIPSDDIDRIRITRTAQESKQFREDVRARREAERRNSSVVVIGGPSLDWHLADEGEDVTDKFITDAPGWQLEKQQAGQQAPRPSAGTREVFVVHGRNQAARRALYEFLRAIDLDPLEWSELVEATGKTSPYIGEILNTAFFPSACGGGSVYTRR